MNPIPWEQASPRASENLSGVADDQYILSEEDKFCFTCSLPECRPYAEKKCPILIYRSEEGSAREAFEAKETAAFVRLAGRLRKTRERFRV